MTSSAGLPQTPPQRPPLRRGVKEAIVALAALPVLVAVGVYAGARLADGSSLSLRPGVAAAAPAATGLPSAPATVRAPAPAPVVTVRPPAPGPVVTVRPPAPGPVVTVVPPAPRPVTARLRPPGPAPPAPLAVLRLGSTGPDVRIWQRQMARRTWRIAVDGIFGPASAAVARRFQQVQGLRVDGLVGRETWTAAWLRPVRY